MPNNIQNKHYGAMFASRDNTYDIQRAYHFYADFTLAKKAFDRTNSTSNNGFVSQGMGTSITEGSLTEVDALMMAVQQFNPPTRSNTPIDYNWGNNKVKLSGKGEVATGDITLVDFVLPDIEGLLLGWYDKVYQTGIGERKERTNLVEAYKFPIKLVQWSADGNTERAWMLEGCFPTSVTFGNFDYTSNDKKQMTVTFSVDLSYRVFGK